MGINFPNTPTTGQTFQNFTWDGEKWVISSGGSGGGAAVFVADTPPTGAPDNALWWESDTGNLYVRYNDGDSTQWVIAGQMGSLTGLVRYDAAQTLTEPQMAQGRSNLYAAPFDAMGWSGLQVNGSIDISQQFGTSGTGATGTYPADNWALVKGGTAAVTAMQFIPSSLPGAIANLAITVQTAQASLAAADTFYVYTPIEGYRTARLVWGTANAQPITIAFWTAHHRTGTYSGTIKNGAQNRCYPFIYTQNVADTWEYKIITIPGDTTGTWAKDNTAGMYISFSMAVGSTYTAPSSGSWLAGNYMAAPGQVNGVAATTDVFGLGRFIVLPGVEAPSAARSPLIMRPFDQELLTCRRYFWRRTFGVNQFVATLQAYQTGNANGFLFNISPELRGYPSASISAPGHFNGQGSNGGGAGAATFTIGASTDAAWATQLSGAGFIVGGATGVYANTNSAWMQFDARL